jgi:uncharacterized membrane protein YciS (DUF1049 family)
MTVTISFLAWEVTDSLSLVLLITLAIGAVIGLLVLAPSAIKSSLAVSSNRKRIGALEHELEEQKARIADLEKPRSASPSATPPTPPSDAPKPQ